MIDNPSLMNKIELAKTNASEWQGRIKHRRDLYHFQHYNGMGPAKDGETRYADPTYTNTVDLAVGILHSNDFRWHVYGWSPSPEDTRDSSAIEKYLAGTIHVNSIREEEDIRLEITQSFVRDGMAVLYTVWDTKEAKANLARMDELDPESDSLTKNSKVYLETPIVMKIIDPLDIYMLPGGNGRWQAIMRSETLSVWDAEQIFDVELEQFAHLSDEDKKSTPCNYIDYWEIEKNPKPTAKKKNIVWNAKVVDDTIIEDLHEMPGYDSLPYTIGIYSNDTSDDPKRWIKGLVDVLENSVQMLETSINRNQHQIDTYTGMPIIVQTKPGRSVNLDKALNTTKIEEGEDIRFPVWQGNPPDVDKQTQFFRSRIQQSGFSESMYGSASGLAGSGYAISQETDQNRIRLTQPVANLQLFWTIWAKKVLSMTEAFAKASKIRVYGRVRGSDFVSMVPGKDATHYIVECRIRPDFPTEKTRKHAMASQARGILSDETLMTEYYDIEQPDDEKQRKLIELAQNNPVVQQYALLLNLTEMAKNGDEAARMALDIVKSQIQQPAPQQSAPNPIQPTGLQSSTGQATPQEQGGLPPGQGEAAAMDRLTNASPNMQGGI